MTLSSDLRADFAVNGRMLDRITVTCFRVNQAAHRGRFRLIRRVFAKALDSIWMQGVVGADMPGRVACGPGLRLPHGGRGVVIHPNVEIGAGVTIYHRVTLGIWGPDDSCCPRVEDDAYIGAGAAIIGPVTIGRGARIGANASVAKDVPAEHVAVGNPALARPRVARTVSSA